MTSHQGGYQNVINIVNENDEAASMNSNFHSSTSSSSGGFNAAGYLSNLGVQLNEEQLQYSSYFNTGRYLDDDRKRKRNTVIAYALIGLFIFWTFVHMATPHSNKHVDSPQVTSDASNVQEAKTADENSSATVNTLIHTDEKVDENIETKSTWSTKPIQEQIVHFSEVASNHFVTKMRNAATNKTVQPGCEATILITTACEKESFNSDRFFHQHCNYVGFERATYFATLFGNRVVTTDRRRQRVLKKETKEDDDAEDDDDSIGDTIETDVKESNATKAEEAKETANGMSKLEEAEVMVESSLVAEEVAALETSYLISQIKTKWPIPAYLYALAPQNRHPKNKHAHNFRELETIAPLAQKFKLNIDMSYSLKTKTDSNNEKLYGMEHLSSDLFSKMRSGDMCGKIAVIAWNHEYIPQLAQYLGCGPMQGCPLEYNLLEYDDVWSIKYVYEPIKLPKIMIGEEGGNENVEKMSDKQIKKEMGQVKGWEMFGTVVKQGFDPLRFSTEVGDYKEKGVDTSGNWIEATQ